MIRQLNYKPTIFKITKNAKNAIAKRQDDDTLAFALETIRNHTAIKTPISKPKNFREFIKNLFSAKSQLEVILDEKQGNFFLNIIRKVGLFHFSGNSVKLDLKEVIHSKKSLDKALLMSKEAALRHIQNYNKAKNFFKI